jgi:hypothetical protein
MRSKVWLAFSLLVLMGVGRSQAYQTCACTCASDCYLPCPLNPTGATCISTGVCAGGPGCPGGPIDPLSVSPDLHAKLSSSANLTLDVHQKVQSCTIRGEEQGTSVSEPDQKKVAAAQR